jgi:hypothetical protein
MKNLFLTLTAVVSVFMAASAQATSYSTTTIGNHTYYSGDISASSTTIGNHTYYSGDISGSSTTIGNHTYYNLD